MKKQLGFTLIELMVVMAIIAILATAGLAAYTGYIKKARDTTRIADIDAISTIVLGMLSANGKPPQTSAEVTAAVLAANNNVALKDPLTTKTVCMNSYSDNTLAGKCEYIYRLCDLGTGYAIAGKLESVSNKNLFWDDNVGTTPTGYDAYFELGSCKAYWNTTDSPACGGGAPVETGCSTLGVPTTAGLYI